MPAACTVRIEPVVGTLIDLPPMTRLRVRGTLGGTRPPAMPTWTWTVRYENSLDITPTPSDMTGATVEFELARPGLYTIRALVLSTCSTSVTASAFDPRTHPTPFWVRITPPPGVSAAVTETSISVNAGAPLATNLELQAARVVALDPQDTDNLEIPSYIRVSSAQSSVFLEGHNDRTGGFRVPLSQILPYSVLVVPDDAIAPAVFTAPSAAALSALPLMLDRGASISGRVTTERGPVARARVLLRAGALPSTVGLTDAQGGYMLWARSGARFGVTIAPPAGSGLPEAHVADSDGLELDTNIAPVPALSFRYDAIATATLALLVRTADDVAPARPVRLRLETESGALPDVGALTIAGGADPITASGFVRVDATTDAGGLATIPALPRALYRVTLAPTEDGSSDAVTTVPLDLGPDTPVSRTVKLTRKVMVSGRLGPVTSAAGATVVAIDDGADLGGGIMSRTVGADGRWDLRLDPGRPFRIYLEPQPARGLPRVLLARLVAPDRDQALEDRTVPRGLGASGLVTLDDGTRKAPVAGAVVQVFCIGGPPDCVVATAPATDLSRPLFEAVSGPDGSYRLMLPDPGSTP
jgi:hypothetical protein